MDLDDAIVRVKQLIAQRENIDAELATILVCAVPSTRKPITCGKCGEAGHSARSCTKPPE